LIGGTKTVYFILSKPENIYSKAVKVFSGELSLIANKVLFIFVGYEWLNISVSIVLSRL